MIGLGKLGTLGLLSGSAGAATVADWPALKLWLKYQEGAGTSLVDSARPPEAVAGSPLFGPLTAQTAGGSPWGVANAFTTLTGAPFTGDTHALSASAFSGNALSIIQGKSVILELDMNMIDTLITDYVTVFCYGAGRGIDTTGGIRVRWIRAPYNYFKFCASGVSNAAETLFSSTSIIGARHHAVFIWDRGSSSIGSVDLWIDGAWVGNYIFADDPGDMTIGANATYNRVGVGIQPGTIDDPTTGNVVHYNTRLWAITGTITNAAAIVAQMFADPDNLPELLRGVT